MRSEKLSMALWENKAIEFLELITAAVDGSVFVVITGLLAKKISDNVFLSSSDATNTYVNIDYAPLHDLKAEMLISTGKTMENLPPPVVKRFVTQEGNTLEDLTIEGLLEATLPSRTTFIRRTCEATIVGIVNAEGWFYNCCPRCARKVRDNEGTYRCENCGKDATDFKQRYKLIVRVEDKSGMTTFTLFNKEAEQLIGIPVETVINNIPQDSSIGNIPAVIKNVFGKKCVFDIKINAYNTERGYEDFTVYRLTECAGTHIEDASKQMEENPAKKRKT
ncbi:hypothetical protein AgCh_022505 [Apium graveolens]